MINKLANTTSRRGLWFIVIMAVVASAIASQTGPMSANAGGPPAYSLEGADLGSQGRTEWVLVSSGGKGVLAETEITASFDGGQVAGSAGCNRYFAGYESDADGLTLTPVGMTMMLCAEPDGVMEQEMAFAGALASVHAYHITGDTLEISYEGGSMVFTAR